MCLINCELIEQKENIDCFKVLYELKKKTLLGKPKFISPYEYEPYKLGVSKYIKKKDMLDFSDYSHIIMGGAFHSFALLKDAEDVACFFNSVYKYHVKRVVIVKCIIPKNSKYTFEGEFEGYKSYASQKITPKEIVYIKDN